MPASSPDRVLAKIEKGEIVIRISADAMRYAFENSDDFFGARDDGEPLKITSTEELMNSFAGRINDEAEDGSTPLIRMLDKAITKVIENGDDGVTEES